MRNIILFFLVFIISYSSFSSEQPEIWFHFDVPQGMYYFDKNNTEKCYMRVVQAMSLDGKIAGTEWREVDFRRGRCLREQELFAIKVSKLLQQNKQLMNDRLKK